MLDKTTANPALALAIIATGSAWTCHMRTFIASEISTGAHEIHARLQTAIRDGGDRRHSSLADIRKDIRSANRSRNRQLADIRQPLSDLQGKHRARARD